MGLAASQGRLLLLTAKKSDLEYKAQSISQARLILAQQQESISRKYADRTSNRCLKFKPFATTENGNGETPEAVDLTFRNLWNSATGLNGRDQRLYKICLPDEPDVMVISSAQDLIDSGNYNSDEFSNNERNKTKGYITTDDGCKWYVDANLKNDNGGPESYLKYTLETGIYGLTKYNSEKVNEDGSTGGWERTSIAGESGFSDEYYTEDDAEAKAEYDMEMLKVKIKDQRLELDLKGVETQHKAVETETESVQKIIQKNVEVGFKTFS